QMATDGSHVVGAGGGGSTATLWYSANQGSTWTNVTPASFSANGGLFYFPGIAKFVAFDNHLNPSKVATSSTGALGTWTVTSMPNQIVPSVTSAPSTVEASGALVIGGNTAGAQPAVIERSIDGNTWVVEASFSPGAFAAFETIAYNGTVWNATGNDNAGGGHFFNYTSPDGITWTQRVLGPQTAPPFIDKQVALGTA